MEAFLNQNIRKKAVEFGVKIFKEKCGLKEEGFHVQS
jgi:hypothetical protein